MKITINSRFLFLTSIFPSLILLVSGYCSAQSASPAQVFRLDGGNVTYAFGVNEHGELQAIYWGGRIGARDSIASAHSNPEMASFDSPYTTTPQEYASWGAGLFTEPALKITFADLNRDPVLHFVSAKQIDTHALEIQLKDISREIYLTPPYAMDSQR